MEDVFEVVTLNGFFTVEKLEEFLDELGCDVNFQRTNFDALVDDQLQEELVDSLKMGPGGIHILFSFNSGLRES